MAYGKHSAPIQISPFERIFGNLLPTKKDNRKQLTVKISFLGCVALMLCLLLLATTNLYDTFLQRKALQESRAIWYNSEFSTAKKYEYLREENKDFKGWLTINAAAIDYPVFQSETQDYYLSHAQSHRKSRYGSLHLYHSDILERGKTDSNLVITGNNLQSGDMFGNLKLFRKLSFYNENPTISFTSLYDDNTDYAVFAVFLIDENADGSLEKYFNPYYSDFTDEETFNNWLRDALARSIIKSSLPVMYTDRLLTLITDADDFKGAKLVVMSRRVRENESEVKNIGTVNPNPKYPRAWYEAKGLDYPY